MLKTIALFAVCGLTVLALGSPLARLALAAPAIATFNVNSTLDEVDDNPGNGLCHSASNHCTLRAAVMEANFSSGAGATIIVPSGVYTLTIPASAGDDASNGDLNLILLPDTRSNQPTAGLTIALVGAGAASTIIDANQIDRVLTVGANRVATISGVTLRGGFVSDSGGGVYNNGALTVSGSTISGNQAVNYGGGIYNAAGLTLLQSTISGNSTTAGSGGGVFNSGTLLAERSTIDDNHADSGGGIYSFMNSLTLVNSTLSGNYAVTDGGGVNNTGQANLYSTTIVGNWADSDRQGAGAGGGVFNTIAGTFNLRNSLVAGNNLGDTPVWDDCDGTLHAYGTDIVGLQGEPAACTIDQPSGGNLYKLNSLGLLSGLQDNGGPTRTIALLAGSSAIMDGGNPVTCTDQNALPLATDQRGAVRVLGGNCDIGAFEFLPPVLFLPVLRR
jgi:CSLREA domain-containing protein